MGTGERRLRLTLGPLPDGVGFIVNHPATGRKLEVEAALYDYQSEEADKQLINEEAWRAEKHVALISFPDTP